MQQAGWSGAAIGRRQRLEGGQEDVIEEARARQAGVAGKTQTLKEEAPADEPYEKRQMLWEGMAGRSWAELVQQWGVPVVEPLQLQKLIAALIMMREIGPRLGDLHWEESTGLGGRARCCQRRQWVCWRQLAPPGG